MSTPYNPIIRIITGDPLARPQDVRERIKDAADRHELSTWSHEEGVEFAAGDLPAAERLLVNPDCNREAGEIILDLSPELANLPYRVR